MLCANDKVVVYVGASRFSGDIHDDANVEAHMADAGFGPPRAGDDGEGEQEEGVGDEGGRDDGDGMGGGTESERSAATRSSLDFRPDERDSTNHLDGQSTSARRGGGQRAATPSTCDSGGQPPTGGGGRSIPPAARSSNGGGAPTSEGALRLRAMPPSALSAQGRHEVAGGFTGLADDSSAAAGAGGAQQLRLMELVRDETHAQEEEAYRAAARLGGRRLSAPDALEHGLQRALVAAHLRERVAAPESTAAAVGGAGAGGDGTAAVTWARGRTATRDAHLSVVINAPAPIRSSSVPLHATSASASASASMATSALNTPELLIASKAEALLQRLEQLERRTREMDASAGARTPAPLIGGSGGRRLSLIGNQKLRRAVHKLVLINRFNKAALLTPAVPISSKLSMRSAGSHGPSALRSSASKSGRTGSRWGFAVSSVSRKSIGKVMDQYIKEQSNLYEYGEVRKSNVKEDEKLPWYIVKPDVKWRVGWDMLMLVLVIYYSLLVPVRIGFDLETCEWDSRRQRACARTHCCDCARVVSAALANLLRCQHPHATWCPAARPPCLHLPAANDEKHFDYFSDCFFIVDIAMSFMTTYKEDGLYVSDRLKIVRTYARSWFPMDVLASMPVGWFTENLQTTSSGHGDAGTGGINKMLRMLRLFKLFRLLRLLKLFPKLLMVIETTVRIDPAILRFLRSFLMLLLMWHIMACAYWFMVRLEYNGTVDCPFESGRPDRTCFINHCLCDVDFTRDSSRITVLNDTDTTWYDADFPDIWVPHAAWANQPVMAQYCRAIMWAVVATTSIGENISPRSVQEHIFTAVMILFGLMMYSMIIGSASSALANLDTEAAEQKQMLDRTIQYMRQRKVPMFFQKIIKGARSCSGVCDAPLCDAPAPPHSYCAPCCARRDTPPRRVRVGSPRDDRPHAPSPAPRAPPCPARRHLQTTTSTGGPSRSTTRTS